MKWLNRNLLSTLTVAMLTAFYWPAQAQQQESKTYSKAGGFYFFPYYSANEFRLTNIDGELSKFKGSGYGLRLGFRPFPTWLPGFSLTADFVSGESENEANKEESLDYTSVNYGFSQYMNRFFYMLGKYGQNKIEVESPLSNSKISPDFVAIGLGLDLFQIGDSFSFTVEALYNKGFSERTKNTNAAYNAGFDGVEYRVGLRWAPSISFTVGK